MLNRPAPLHGAACQAIYPGFVTYDGYNARGGGTLKPEKRSRGFSS